MLREEGRGGERRRSKWDDCHSEVPYGTVRY